MSIFKSIFGIDAGEVQKKCVLVPCLSKELLAAFGLNEPARGKIYACAQGKDFTLIHARVGTFFVGDVVLYLSQTPCRQVFLFGSCGSAGALDVGQLVVPIKCFARESFSALLYDKDKPWPVFYPDDHLCGSFQKGLKNHNVDKVACMTLSSLKLEEELSGQFRDNGVDVIDMECSAFFAAASKVGLPAMGLFYVADVLIKKPFYMDLAEPDKQAMRAGMVNGIKALCVFIQKNSND